MNDPQDKTPSYAYRYLWILIFINLFNYIDRQVLSAVLPRLQLDGTLFSPNDEYLQFKSGLLTSAFMISYMLFSPIIGWMDGLRYRRWVILGCGVSLWSIASGMSGFAESYWMLLLTRCLVGIGEGAYGPVASAMIADMFSTNRRGKAMALFNMAIPVGSAIGFLVGAKVSAMYDDWRPAFWFTFSGVILGLWCFFQKEPTRPISKDKKPPRYFETVRAIRNVPSFVYCCIGMTCITFVIGSVAALAPAFLFQREAQFEITSKNLSVLEAPAPDGPGVPILVLDSLRVVADDNKIRSWAEQRQLLRDTLSPTDADQYSEVIFKNTTTEQSPQMSGLTIIFGAMIVLGGLLATAVGAWLGEKLRMKISGAYFYVISIGAFIAIPSYLGFLYLPLYYVGWFCIFFTVFGLFLHTGPAFTALANVTTTSQRATAFAINILVIHAFGDALSPSIIGLIADYSDLQFAFTLQVVMILLGGIFWWRGAKYLEADTQAVNRAEEMPNEE